MLVVDTIDTTQSSTIDWALTKGKQEIYFFYKQATQIMSCNGEKCIWAVIELHLFKPWAILLL